MRGLKDTYLPKYNNLSSWVVFFLSAIVYLLTIDHSASYWDCPEYITCASRLEVGHPPGNPIWMLAMRFATMPFPTHLHAVVVNACSAICMAFAAFFLARIVFAFSLYVLQSLVNKDSHFPNTTQNFIAACASSCAGLSYAFCDSAWFSAVEAEVYAMSAMLTSLSVWLMVKWAVEPSESHRNRLLILVAYITGLSLGVHELNLLCIPVFALMIVFRHYPRHATWKAWGAIFISFIIVSLILIGIMKWVLAGAEYFELFAVNKLGLPYFSGVITYAAFLCILFPLLAFIIGKSHGRISNVLLTINWMTAFIILGYSSFALILIRGYASTPMNEATPTDIFALSSYIARDQYGSKPLFYGATPYSKPMLQESWMPGDSRPQYRMYALNKQGRIYAPFMDNARVHYRSGLMESNDSSSNERILDGSHHGYVISDYSFTRKTTPELDMFFPRITGTSNNDIESYRDWTGMDKETMTKVRISEAYDTLGNPVGRMLSDGSREEKYSWRPTYLQNLQMLGVYQIYYMYFRYVLWNFIGRQNDFHSTGEIEHGNFITGVPAIDNLMLGDQSLLPDYVGKRNPGRHVYYGIPFILGILGIVYLLRMGKQGKRISAIVTLMFLMTGLAIVVYLNQTPGEARERDYSFLGSYMAFCIWIGFGIQWLLFMLRKKHISSRCFYGVATILSLISPAILFAQNYGDHQRAGRSEPLDFAADILNTNEPAIIFSHGDNTTFPLWYAQETEGIGKQHSVIDIAYINSPGYVVNLMKQGGNGVKLTAKPSDIAFGAYAFTRIAADADTTAVPLMEALRELYAQRTGAPLFHHSNVLIPGHTDSDTVRLNLHTLASGGSLIPFRTLMLLDIIATNNESDSPRPLIFLYPVTSDFHKAVTSSLKEGYGSHIYYPQDADSLSTKNLASNLRIVLERLQSNSTKHYYRDPIVADVTRRQRGNMIIAARHLLDRGYPEIAEKTVETIIEKYPYDDIPAGSFTVSDSTYHEGVEFGFLLMELNEQTGKLKYKEMVESHANKIDAQAKAWQRYYRSLSPRQRTTVANSTLHIIASLSRIASLKNSLIETRSPLHLDSGLNKVKTTID